MANDSWYANDTDFVKNKLETSDAGLPSDEVTKRQEKYGLNELVETGGISPLRMFINQFLDPMVIILIIAIFISLATALIPGSHEEGGFIDSIVITSIVIFNAIFGFVQEYKSEQALEALKEMAAPRARVMRDGLWTEIESKYLVPGDLIALESGDKVAADARVISAMGFSADEAPLTGESIAVRKITDSIHLTRPVIGDMKNMVFQGTIITAGKGQAVVTSTGMQTEFGKIATLVQESEKEMTPLQIDLDDLGKKLGSLIIVLVILVFAAEVLRNVSDSLIEELMAAIALAVSAIPEGLPAVVTITLAIGVQRMVQENAIVRRLPSVETLGSTTVICSDKTGTITKNEMTVKVLYTDGKAVDVSGTGYTRKGKFTYQGIEIDPATDANLSRTLQIGQLCSNTILQPDPTGKADWSLVGDPTEGALLVAAEKAGIHHSETIQKYKEISEISFDSARKRMTAITIDDSGSYFGFSKGAPEILLRLCSEIYYDGKSRPLTDQDRKRILDVNAELAESALRVLALAYKPIASEIPDWEPEQVEKNLIFVGLVGMMDPPRDEVKDAIKICKTAGIRPIMITGDHKLTARAIAHSVGLIERDGKVLTGAEIDQMTKSEFNECVHSCNVFARVAPEHKLQIVKALRNSNQVVAMTGDGVNDAPAVKAADVGISMGIRGADVTKEASDVILTDDNFATIVTAVEKGREIYSNIRKFVRFLLAANFDEVFLVFTIIMIGLPLPITAIQILWLNLATDGFPALALGVDPPEKGVMKRSPRKPGAKMMDKGMISYILIAGFMAFLASTTVFLFSLWELSGGVIPGITAPLLTDLEWRTAIAPSGWTWDLILTHARTNVFASVVTFELLFVWNCRDEYNPIWRTSIRESKTLIAAVLLSVILTLATIYVPFMQPLFETVALDLADWALILITCIPALLIPPHKIFGRFRDRKEN
ncbi:MAG: cation-translocating P-type ATPase [Candidatus Thorarchaeota archaeon]|nr:cation-translocating P-type ATPase [Candidatus Thorarchaeota archaeon]